MNAPRALGTAAVLLGFATGAAGVGLQNEPPRPPARARVQEPAQKPDLEPKALELKVRPRAMQGPGTIRVTAIVERHAANREITLEAESGTFLRSSTQALEGADGPTKYTRVFSGLPPGTYEVTARLERNDGTEILDVVSVRVFGRR